MRDIKFRIRDKSTGEDLTLYCSIYASNGNIACIHQKYIDLSIEECKAQFIVEQYTGLSDKHGKEEVYEGDTVRETFSIPQEKDQVFTGTVVWWDSGWFVQTENVGPISLTDSAEIEIIGNVHSEK